MEINELIGEADRHLREADPLCSDANAYYAEMRVLVEQSTILWARILFLHTAQQDQLQNMGNVCLVIKNAVDKSQQESHHRIKALRRSRAELRTLLESLKATPLDPAFRGDGTIEGAPTTEKASLYHFVHEDDISALEARVDEMTELVQRQLVDLDRLPAEVQAQLADLRTRGPNVQDGVLQSEIPRKMARITSRAAPFASHMADLLVALTSHYDLCSQIPQLPAEDAAQAMQVVLGDREQVQSALNQLKDARSQLKARHRESQRMQHSLDIVFEQCKSYETELATFVTNTLQPALGQVEATFGECKLRFPEIDAVTNELSSLAEYYKLFMKSYHALIVEIGRRHESAKQLSKVVENANNALAGFHKRESEMRAEFSETYHQFLPPELWSGLAHPPKEYSIQLEPEPLPVVSKDTLLTALRDHQ